MTANMKAALKARATLDAGARPSAFDIAQEVWQSQKTSYNASGTMGNALNAAGSGGVDLNALAVAVWTYASRTLTGSAGGMTPQQEAMLRELFEIHGLDPAKPLQVSQTQRQAGGINQDISESSGTTTVTRT